MLKYDTEVMAPAEVGMISLRVKYFDLKSNKEKLGKNLDLFEEVREKRRHTWSLKISK